MEIDTTNIHQYTTKKHDTIRSQLLTAAGSNRRYYREWLNDGTTYIRVEGTSQDENKAFVAIAKHLSDKQLPVPQILWVDQPHLEYAQTDLGDTSLFDFITHGRSTGQFTQEEIDILRKTIRTLIHMQIEGAKGLNWNICYPIPQMDRRSIQWDLNYWKYCYLKNTNIDFSEPLLEDDFDQLTDYILTHTIQGFMLRDCQSRNVMIVQKEGELLPYFIDFQGGRKGAIQYDVASFLWQAKANIPDTLRQQLITEYLNEWLSIDPQADTHTFIESLPHFVLFRTLQVLGAYGYRGFLERKPHFLQSIPFAIHNLQTLFEIHPSLQTTYPYLYTLAQQLTCPQQDTTQDTTQDNNLTITIYSFSYKKGLPKDTSGNGGGYVFDCRSTHNPGKYDEYKTLTGRDLPVQNFLEQDGEILHFLNHVYALVSQHTERFIERHFTHLQIAFGCTGGQHRSVYAAEATAKYLHRQYSTQGVRIHLIHREQNIDQWL